MVRYSFILVCALSLGLRAQTARLVKPLSDKDKAFLERKMYECLLPGADISFSYNSADLYKITKHDSACSLGDIQNLSKKLKGSEEDASIYVQMGSVYKRLRLPLESDSCFRKAVALELSVIASHPDSAAAVSLLSMTYMAMSRFQESKQAAKQCLLLAPLDTTMNAMLPMLYMFCGEFDSTRMILKEQISRHGNGFYSYASLPLCDFFEFATKLTTTPDQAGLVNWAKDHDIIDLESIRVFYLQDTTVAYRSLLYQVAKHLDDELRILSAAFADSTRAVGDYHIGLTARDRRGLDASEAFFKRCAKNNPFENMYYVYKVLGSIAFLKGEYKKAVPFMKRTIELKPMNKSSLQNNAAEDYHNLEAVYFLAGDTLASEKLILESLIIKPAIDSSAGDYKAAGQTYMHRREYAKAKEMYLTAASLGSDAIEVWLGLAMANHLLKDDKACADYLARAYAIDNSDWRVFALSGLISLEQGKTDDAYFMLDKSRQVEKSVKWIEKDVLKKYMLVQ